ncbi:MAG: hypothetical protein ACLFUB_12845 [Cyclobacteriaceae bacterium]
MKITQKELLKSSRKSMRWTAGNSPKPTLTTDKKKKASKNACRKKVRTHEYA